MNMPNVIKITVIAVVQVTIAPPLLALRFLILSAWQTLGHLAKIRVDPLLPFARDRPCVSLAQYIGSDVVA